jgi:hypothetical protein
MAGTFGASWANTTGWLWAYQSIHSTDRYDISKSGDPLVQDPTYQQDFGGNFELNHRKENALWDISKMHTGRSSTYGGKYLFIIGRNFIDKGAVNTLRRYLEQSIRVVVNNYTGECTTIGIEE